MRIRFLSALLLAASVSAARAALPAPAPDLESLYRLWDGNTKQVNALWPENPKKVQFGEGRSRVVIAGAELERLLHQSDESRDMWHSRPRLCQRREGGPGGVQARAPVPTSGIPVTQETL